MRLLVIPFLLLSICCFSQKAIDKTIPVKPGQKLILNFDYPKVIRIQTWDKNEVSIKGTASINRGENDDAFELQVISEATATTVTSVIKDKENLPQRIVIKMGEQEYYFKAKDWTDPEVQKFLEEHGRDYSYMSNGVIKEIELDVKVPKGMMTTIDAKYGLVEVSNFDAPLTIDAKYGGIDITVASATTGELIARTRYGEILTNLDIKFDSDWDKASKDKWTEIVAKPGKGPSYMLESKYGKVYLRKPKS
jgi:hypothetical protein